MVWLKKDGFQSLTNEVILDVTTTSSYPGDHNYGRLLIELDRTKSSPASPGDAYQSGPLA